jgi:hypothetical protein
MSDRSIIEAIQAITGSRLKDRVYIAACNVESVDEAKRAVSCTLIDGPAELKITAALMAVVDDGMLLIPTVNSTVKVVFSDYASPFVCQYSELDKITLIVGESQLIVQDGLFEFNKGELNGLVKLSPLIQKLNNLENAFNDLASKFNTHTHILALSAGTGTAAQTAAPETTVLTETQQADLENTKIKQ